MIFIMLILATLTTDAALLDAIKKVESGGDSEAVGDGGASIGILQIQRCCWDDVKNTKALKGYVYKDCFKPHVAEIVFREYIKRYATKKRLGHEPTFEDKARIWNGGPNGYKKKATLKYWEKVKAVK